MAINQNDIIYFIVTDRFYGVENPDKIISNKIDKSNPFKYHGGNFDGIIEKIPYLKKLGITCLWITPVYTQLDLEKVDAYHGYWALDFNAINPMLYIDNKKHTAGSKLYLKDLIDELHKNGIKLILDMVVNHTGYNHPGLKNEETNPTPIQTHWFHNSNVSLDHDEITGQLAGLPDFDLDNSDICDYHIQTIISWIRETGIDAVRMDTVKHVEFEFWNQYKTLVKGLYPDISLLGEVLVFDIEKLSSFQKYSAFDQLFDFPMQEAIKKAFIEDTPLTSFVSPFNQGYGILEKDKSYTNHNKLVTLLDNHDLYARYMTFILQKHNDIKIAEKIMKVSLTFMFSIRGIPQIFYGTEIGLQGAQDPDNRRDMRWEIFDKNYDVKPEYEVEKSIFDHTCKLVEIRKKYNSLTSGYTVCLYVDNYILVFLRYIDNEVTINAFHNGWWDMPEEIKINTNLNGNIPVRIRKLIENIKFKCGVSDKELQLENGEFTLKMKAKDGHIFV
jgi:glycosidase